MKARYSLRWDPPRGDHRSAAVSAPSPMGSRRAVRGAGLQQCAETDCQVVHPAEYIWILTPGFSDSTLQNPRETRAPFSPDSGSERGNQAPFLRILPQIPSYNVPPSPTPTPFPCSPHSAFGFCILQSHEERVPDINARPHSNGAHTCEAFSR